MTAALHVEAVGSGPPLVLLHGWGMHGGFWGPLLHPLAARHRVHVVDLPGHGHSTGRLPPDLRATAALLAARFAGDAPCKVLGWSLGALVAMQWALAEPAAIDALVLVGATPRFVTAPDWPHAMDPATLARFGDELAVSYRLALQRFLSLQLQGGDDAGRRTLATLRATLFARGDPDRAALAAGLEILRATDLRDRVREIQQPTLVIAGERDALAPAAASRWLAGAMPAARLAVISGAGHVSFLSHPDAFVGALAEFEHAAA